jgi:glycosyltransferase involved in cell wall biosynthesis
MKIILVSHYFLPRHRAGVENYTYRLARELGKKDSAAVYCREDGFWDQEFHEEDDLHDGIPVHRVYYNRPLNFRTHYDNPDLDRAFERYLTRQRPDVVHFQHLDRLSAGFIQVAHRLGIPRVLTLNDFWFICSQIQMLRGGDPCLGPAEGRNCASCPTVLPDSVVARIVGGPAKRWGDPRIAAATSLAARLIPIRLYTSLRRRVASKEYASYGVTPEATGRRFQFLQRMFRLVDLVLMPSRFVAQMFQQAGFDHPRLIYSDYGIPAFQRLPTAGDSPHVRFGYFSAVVPHKGIELLVQSFRRVASPDVRLLVQGQGNEDYLVKVKQLAGNDSRITFRDPYDGNAALAEAFSQIDVLVVPSLWYENSPIVIHEAAMAGVPVVAADIGGMAEYVRPGENGVLFRFRDGRDLQRKLELFVEDRTLHARLDKVPFRLKTIEDDGAELRQHYAGLVTAP